MSAPCTQCGQLTPEDDLADGVCIWCEPTLELIVEPESGDVKAKDRRFCYHCLKKKVKIDYGVPNRAPFWCCPNCGEE